MNDSVTSHITLILAKAVALASMIPFAGAMAAHDLPGIRLRAVIWFVMLFVACALASLSDHGGDHYR